MPRANKPKEPQNTAADVEAFADLGEDDEDGDADEKEGAEPEGFEDILEVLKGHALAAFDGERGQQLAIEYLFKHTHGREITDEDTRDGKVAIDIPNGLRGIAQKFLGPTDDWPRPRDLMCTLLFVARSFTMILRKANPDGGPTEIAPDDVSRTDG